MQYCKIVIVVYFFILVKYPYFKSSPKAYKWIVESSGKKETTSLITISIIKLNLFLAKEMTSSGLTSGIKLKNLNLLQSSVEKRFLDN